MPRSRTSSRAHDPLALSFSLPLDRIRDDVARARFACDAVCFALGQCEDLLTPTRGAPDAALARQMAMYLTHVGFGMSLSRVAVAFARDRSTVAHACRLMEDRRDSGPFDDLLSALEHAVRGAPPPGSARRLIPARESAGTGTAP